MRISDWSSDVCSSDLLETADAALLGNRVTGVAELISLSRATMTNIHQNVAIALGLKAVFLVTTLLGVTDLWLDIVADTGATVIVTLNALRLLGHEQAKEAPTRAEHPQIGRASCRGRGWKYVK